MPVIIYIRYFIIRDEMHYECTNVLISRNIFKTRVLILTQTIFLESKKTFNFKSLKLGCFMFG